MKKLIKKLKSSSGESIGETLVALLIAALALLMLAVAITATTRIITNSSEKVDDYFDKSNTKLVKMSGANTGKISITEKSGSGGAAVTLRIPVEYGKVSELSRSNPVIAFKKKDD